MINWKRVSELFEDFGEDGFADVIEVFVAEAEESLERLQGADTDDALRAEFHFLKGAAMTLGFDTIAQICAEGETRAAARQDSTDQKNQVIKELPATCARFLEEWHGQILGGQTH